MLPVLLALCMILTACGTDTCEHTNQELRNVKNATCTEEGYSGDLVCADCGAVITAGTVTPKADHTWGEWTVTKPATASEAGSQTHTCTVCGASESQEIPATDNGGNTVQDPIESFEDLLDVVFQTMLQGEAGTLSLTYEMPTARETLQLTVNRGTDGGYTAQIEVEIKEDSDTTDVNVYYRNGVFVYEEEGEFFLISDIDAVAEGTFADYVELLKLVGTEVNAQVEEFFNVYDAMLEEVLAQYGDQFEETMVSLGLTCKTEDVTAAVSALKNSYAKVCAYFGIETSVTGEGEITLPTREDWLAVCELFMTKNATEEKTEYTLDLTSLKAILEAYVEQLQTVCDTTIADCIFATVGSLNPTWKDWADLEAYIRENISGSMTCGKFIDCFISLVNASGVCTMDDIYDLIDAIVASQTGEEFDSEAFLLNYSTLTLDEFVALLFDDSVTLDSLYDTISNYMQNTKIGDLVVYSETIHSDENIPSVDFGKEEDSNAEPEVYTVTLSEALTMFDNLLNALNLNKLGFGFAVDQNSQLLEWNLDIDVLANSGDDKVQLILVALKLERDATAIITVPETVEKLLASTIDTSYDDDGNLTIGGLNADVEWNFNLSSSSVIIPFSDALEKDETMTAQCGFEVYSLKAEYCSDGEYNAYYAKVDDRFVSLEALQDVEDSYKQLESVELPGGGIVYVKGTTPDGWTYGYRFLSDDVCVWTAFGYANGSLYVMYCGEEDELCLFPNSVYDLEDYMTKNDDGTYTISTELFEALDALIVGDFQSYSIAISGDLKIGEVHYCYRYVVASHVLFGDISSGLGGTIEMSEPYFEWYFWFYYQA